MAKIRGNADARLQQYADVLRDYEGEHPRAKVDIYRQNEVSVWIRIIDPGFKGKSLSERDPEVWRLLNQLPDDVASDVTFLVLLTPAEARKSDANYEFDHPTPCPPELLKIIEENDRRNGRRHAKR
jgi:hypothetical protein